MLTKQDYKETSSFLGWIAFIVSFFILVFIVWNFIIAAPAKMIHNYEWFHQQYASHKAYVEKISNAKKDIESATNQDEKFRLRNELTGLKNMCYNGVTAYNARALQITTKWAQDTNLPNMISNKDCE